MRRGVLMSNKGVEIICPNCKREALLRQKPKYDGFKRVGEELSCVLCGHVFESEAAVPFKNKRKTALFNANDLPKTPKVFKGNENAQLCRYCAEYVINPFTQWCNRRQKDVQATDTCPDFTPKPIMPDPDDSVKLSDNLRQNT